MNNIKQNINNKRKKLSLKERKIKKAIYYKEYRNKNREIILKKKRQRSKSLEYKEKRKLYIEKNKNKIKQKKSEYDRIYRKINKDKIKNNKKKYYSIEKNKKKHLAKCKEYRKISKYKRNTYLRNKTKSNINFKILKNLRSRISIAVKKIKKSNSTKNLIGISLDDFRLYLESKFKGGMTWDNYSRNGWHIDHIKPCASFDLTDPEQQKQCFHYTNLQPLWWYENLSKGCKL